jgi:tetratricopeptide (TPR) repeat protein
MPERLPTVPGRRADRVARPLELSAEHRDALRLLGYLLLRQNHAEDAVAVFRGLLATGPDDRHAHRALIYSYLAVDDAERALELAASYLPRPHEPRAATIHLLRAQALWRLGRPEEARDALQRFVELRGVS